MGLAPALDDERLHTLLVEVVDELRQWALAGQHHPLRVRTVPVAHGQQRVLSGVGGVAYKDGVFLGPQLVRQHLGLFVANLQGSSVVVDKSVGGLGPLQ